MPDSVHDVAQPTQVRVRKPKPGFEQLKVQTSIPLESLRTRDAVIPGGARAMQMALLRKTLDGIEQQLALAGVDPSYSVQIVLTYLVTAPAEPTIIAPES